MRGKKGIEQRTINAIRRLRAAAFPIAISTSTDKLNIGRLVDTYELMKRLDIQCWIVASPQELGNWEGAATALSLHEEAEAYAPVLKQWIVDGKPFDIQLGAFFRGLRSKPGAYSRDGSGKPTAEAQHTPDNMRERYDCDACREQPNLLPDGTLIPCPGYVDSPLHNRMPNLLREELASVWTQSLLRQVVEIKKKDLLACNPQCVDCKLFKECGMGCRASALRQTGNLMTRDPIFCDLWKGGHIRRFQQLAVL